MMLLSELLPILSQSLPAEVCWTDEYSEELCCDRRYGPEGNAACWAGELTFEGCCGETARALPEAGDLPFEKVKTQDLHPQIGIGLFMTYEPGKDCWTGMGGLASHAMCCDLSLSEYGMGSCWDGWRYTFDRCCFLGEAPAFRPPAKPLLRPPKEPAAPKAGRGAARPSGVECWQSDFTFAYCCMQGAAACWDDQFTRAACCDGIADPVEAWKVADASDPQVICLLNTRNVALDLEQTPKHCPKERFFLLASLGPPVIEEDWTGTPWFRKPWSVEGLKRESIHRLQPLRPSRTSFVGGLCVPEPCSLETTAAYLAPRVVPWWRAPRPEPQLLNETHFLLPPPLAARHKVYRSQRLSSAWTAWVAPRPTDADVFAEKLHGWEFAILEHGKYIGGSVSGLITVTLMILAAAATGLLVPREASEFPPCLAPQFHLLRLGLARGPRDLDVVRLWLTAVVIFIHVVDHGPWLPVTQRTSGAWLWLLRSGLNRVNVAFVVLLVHLSISRRSLKQAITLWGWVRGLLYHILKRWLVISPVVSFWSFVFVHAPFTDVPMNNILKSHALFHHYSAKRDECEHPLHLLSSSFLVHGPLMGRASPCMNTDIFESLFQVDVVAFGLLSAMGRFRAATLAHLLWVLVASGCSKQASTTPTRCFLRLAGAAEASFNGARSTCDPGHLFLVPRQQRLSPQATNSQPGCHCVGATCLQDALTTGGEFEFPLPSLEGMANFLKALHPIGQEQYVIFCHFYELVFVLGMVIHLKLGWQALPQRQEGSWSLLRFLSRLSPGLCLSNLFVLHFAGAYVLDEPVELSVYVCCAYLLMTFVLSLFVPLMHTMV
ncbi:unnamed protein product [Symbiodinium sp. CCMP2592]|nr:unnamed protein product [Symbiodinium sp. CCMP2592]